MCAESRTQCIKKFQIYIVQLSTDNKHLQPTYWQRNNNKDRGGGEIKRVSYEQYAFSSYSLYNYEPNKVMYVIYNQQPTINNQEHNSSVYCRWYREVQF
jgi:hypothetical protein